MTFTVATFNTLHGTAQIHPLADVIGWQEVDTPAGRAKVKALAGYATFIPDGALSAIPISWRKDRFELVVAGATRTHPGRAGVTPDRGYSRARLRDRQTGEVLTFVNTHFISGAWSAPRPDTDWRRARWNEHLTELAAFVASLEGRVVLVGDFNRAKWLPVAGLHHATTTSGIPIDQIYATVPLGLLRRGQEYGSDHYARTTTIPAKEATVTYKLEHAAGAPSSTRAHYGHAGKPTGITIHHWGSPGQTHDGVVKYLTRDGANTSAHAVVSAGRVTKLVDYMRAAWHAGSTEGNGKTIGIECRPEMSAEDWRTLVEFCTDLEEEFGSMRYYRHSDWKATACPGKYGPLLGKLIDDINAEHARRRQPAARPKTPNITAFLAAKTTAERTKFAREIVEHGAPDAVTAAKKWLAANAERVASIKTLRSLEVK